MAGSRREAVGSIFKRLQGLLRSGAMKEEDRPIWFDVVKAFPPTPVPPPTKVQKMLYPEDFVRVQFHRVYSFNGMTSLVKESSKNIPEKFVNTYMELSKTQSVPPNEIFERTAQTLKEQGIRLLRHDEVPVKKTQQTAKSERTPANEEIVDIKELFSEKT